MTQRVQRVRFERMPQQVRERLDLEELLLRHLRKPLEDGSGVTGLGVGLVVEDDGGLLARNPLHEVVELHPDQPALLAELGAVALDLLGHPGRHLRTLEHDEHVIESDRALELERGEPGEALVESLSVGLQVARAWFVRPSTSEISPSW